MKLILIISILLFLVPFVYAEEVLIRTNITLNAVSWIDNDTNQAMMNITIITTNIDGVKNFIVNNVHETYNNFFNIAFLRNLDCGNTTLGKIDRYFSDCDGKDCKEAYITCNANKGVVEQNKDECDFDKAKFKNERDDFNSNLTLCNNNLDSKSTEYNSCVSDKSVLANSSVDKKWGWLLLAIFAFGYWKKDELAEYIKKHRVSGKVSESEKYHRANYGERDKSEKIRELLEGKVK